jgi:Abortive infection bacteriophage resistance protein
MNIKIPTTFEEQVELLERRGCEIGDRVHCELVLRRVNYYNFSAYFLPFKNTDGTYLAGTTFNNVYRIYEFDRKMRRLLFSAIEEVELYLRTQLSYYHAHKYGSLGYLDERNYNQKHRHANFLEKFEKEIEYNKKSLIVKHHRANYDGKFPIWVATEFFTFGMLSYLYGDLLSCDQKYISNSVYGYSPSVLVSWLRCCTDLRNACAHYSRLYYRTFKATPATPKKAKAQYGNDFKLKERLFDNIFLLKELYPDGSKWNSEMLSAIHALLEEYSNCVVLEHIGFPKDWAKYLTR